MPPDNGSNHIFKYINAKLPHLHSQLAATAVANNAMLLLQAVEQYLGSLNTWPLSVIFSLFAESPSPRVVEYLTEFFAGIALPKTLAYRLYSACNPKAANELVRQLFYARYSLWHSYDTVQRHSMYYDVRMKKLVRRNVPYLPDFVDDGEDPIPVPGLQSPRLGVENTRTAMMINPALQLLRQEVL